MRMFWPFSFFFFFFSLSMEGVNLVEINEEMNALKSGIGLYKYGLGP